LPYELDEKITLQTSGPLSPQMGFCLWLAKEMLASQGAFRVFVAREVDADRGVRFGVRQVESLSFTEDLWDRTRWDETAATLAMDTMRTYRSALHVCHTMAQTVSPEKDWTHAATSHIETIWHMLVTPSEKSEAYKYIPYEAGSLSSQLSALHSALGRRVRIAEWLTNDVDTAPAAREYLGQNSLGPALYGILNIVQRVAPFSKARVTLVGYADWSDVRLVKIELWSGKLGRSAIDAENAIVNEASDLLGDEVVNKFAIVVR
jgi:hypothetical protein